MEANLDSNMQLGIEIAYAVWMRSLAGMLDLMMPSESRSFVYVPPVANGISSFSLNFFGFVLIPNQCPNVRA
jgi:hypothetical protein